MVLLAGSIFKAVMDFRLQLLEPDRLGAPGEAFPSLPGSCAQPLQEPGAGTAPAAARAPHPTPVKLS